MKNDMEALQGISKAFRDAADIIDEIIALDDDASEEQTDALTGRMIIKMAKIQALLTD